MAREDLILINLDLIIMVWKLTCRDKSEYIKKKSYGN